MLVGLFWWIHLASGLRCVLGLVLLVRKSLEFKGGRGGMVLWGSFTLFSPVHNIIPAFADLGP